MYRKGKDIRKKTSSCFCLFSFCFQGEVPTAEFGMISAETSCWEIERKQPNVLMRTFTCRSTFLYDISTHCMLKNSTYTIHIAVEQHICSPDSDFNKKKILIASLEVIKIRSQKRILACICKSLIENACMLHMLVITCACFNVNIFPNPLALHIWTRIAKSLS